MGILVFVVVFFWQQGFAVGSWVSRDVAMGGVVTEEESIARAQYLDLVY